MNKLNINSYDRATQAAITKQVKTKRPKNKLTKPTIKTTSKLTNNHIKQQIKLKNNQPEKKQKQPIKSQQINKQTENKLSNSKANVN